MSTTTPAPGAADERVVPALPMPASTRQVYLTAPDAAFDVRVQTALVRRRAREASDADEVLSGHRGPITAGED